MTKLANAQFLANAQAIITWGRALTAEEATALTNAKIALINGGAMCGTGEEDQTTYVETISWSTADAANSYVATCNTFSPAPQSATVVAL